jgi:hypothetical protein
MATATATNRPPTLAELTARLAELEAENANLVANQKQASQLTWKTSSKGGIILYGMQRFPVTLKAEQWERLIAMAISGEIADVIAKHRAGKLPVKQVSETPAK